MAAAKESTPEPERPQDAFARVFRRHSLAAPLAASFARVARAGPQREGADSWRAFPAEFLWGVATAAFQIEGAAIEGRGASIWDTFSHVPGNILEDATADVACDHFHRYQEDVQLIKRLGARAYRFSISWSRVLPNGTLNGGISEQGLAFYTSLCEDLIANGIEPVATLYHWDLPQALEDTGGWLNRKTVDAFQDYAQLCFSRLGRYIKTWCSINEPWTQCILGYCFGSHAPGRSIAPGEEPYLAAHHMLLAHAAAAKVYRGMKPPGGRLAMVLNTEWPEAQEPENPQDIDAVERFLAFNIGWFADPLYTGDYPELMKSRVGERLPKFSEAEKTALRGSNDFFALNCYSSRYICEDTPWRKLRNSQATLRLLPYISDVAVARLKAALSGEQSGTTSSDSEAKSSSALGGPASPPPDKPVPSNSWITDASYETAVPLDVELTATGWPVAHFGLGRLLVYLQQRYHPPGGILVTEAGAAFKEASSSETSSAAADAHQAAYLQSQAVVLRRAMQEGADVRGYIWWTLMDNFEWSYGYSKRFGLYEVDFAGSLARSPRPAAATFQKLAEQNCVASTASDLDFARCLDRPDGLAFGSQSP